MRLPSTILNTHEGDQTNGRAGDVEQPEGRRRQARIEAADPADESVGDEEGEIIEPDHRGVDRLGRDLGEEREADRQDMREADAVEKVEHHRPEQADLAAVRLGQRGHEQAQRRRRW